VTTAPASSGGLRIALLTGAIGWRGSSAIYASVATGLAARGHETLVLVDDAGLAARMDAEGRAHGSRAVAQYRARRDARVREALAPFKPQVLMADRPRDLRVAAVATLGWPTRLLYRYNLAHRRYPGDAMSRFALWRATAVAYPSRAIARLARERTPRLRGFAATLVPNGVDTARFRPDPRRVERSALHGELPPRHGSSCCRPRWCVARGTRRRSRRCRAWRPWQTVQ
jgi:hypothetical protein